MIAIIPARSGSQRIPNKNIKEFKGKPIIQHSIEIADLSGLFDDVYVTTDSSKYARIAKNCGAKAIERENYLATDDVGTQEVTKGAILKLPVVDIYCCIYATAPLMDVRDLWVGIDALESNYRMNYAFSVATNPLQDAGQFYFGRKEAFLSGAPLISEKSIMIPIDEKRVCDINTMDDWHEAERKYDELYK